MGEETFKDDVEHLESSPQAESTEDIFRRKFCYIRISIIYFKSSSHSDYIISH